MSLNYWAAPKNWGAPYEIRITRGDSHFISLDEWVELVEGDQELHWSPDDDLEVDIEGGDINRLRSVYWRRPSNWDFLWCWGTIRTYDPPPEGLDKMVKMAKALRAYIVGEGGERFGPDQTVVER